MTGYDLRRVFTTTLMWHFSSRPGAIYPELQCLVLDWSTELSRGKTHFDQKSLYIIEDDRQVLEQSLEQPITQDDVIRHKDDLVLRFTFMGNILGRETLSYLKELLIQRENYITYFQEHLDTKILAESPYDAFFTE